MYFKSTILVYNKDSEIAEKSIFVVYLEAAEFNVNLCSTFDI